MKRILGSTILATWLILAGPAHAQTLPPVVERYEQLLVRSPGKGAPFDKIYQHFFEGEGLEKLAARWQSKADAGGPDAATYSLLLGVLAERQGKTPEALRLYQKAVDLQPGNARAWSALGEAQAAAGHLPQAITALQKALASKPTPDLRPQLFRQLARSQQRAFDGDGALQTWKQFIAETPDDPFVIEEAADAMAENERFAEARAQYEKLRDLGGTDPYKRVTAIIKLAQLEEKQNHREAAQALYESALPLASPASWMHREVRSRIEEGFRRQDDLPGLTAYYEAALKNDTKDVDVALRLSDVLIELNRKSEAVSWLRKASDWAPDRNEVQVALAKRLGEIEQPQEAVTILQKLVQAHPEEDSYREFLGDAQWQVFQKTHDEAAKRAAIESWQGLIPPGTKEAGRVARIAEIFRGKDLKDEALAGYARAVGLAPDVPELRQHWAEYLFELKRDDEGGKVLRDMVAGPRATAPNFLRLARILQRRTELPGALEAVSQGLALAPQDFELLMLQWRLFSETNQWAEAAGLFEKLLAAAPSVYSVDQVEDQQVQALRGLGQLDEVSKQLARRLEGEPPLSESEMRLLLRITLQAGDLDTAGEAIAVVRKKFPDSTALLRRQVEYEKRKGNLAGRVAALQRLVELQPKQKIDWLREIVRAYQDDGQWEQALTAVQRVIDEAPASADSQVLAADVNFGAQRFDAGVAKLREAIKLSDRPNDLRLRLARTFLEAGRSEEARQTYDAAFEAETDPKIRLALTRQLAEVYMQSGKLDELIARFRQRQRAEEGGWRYALYLAEIFQQMQDFTKAREELSKALGARSRDGNFLRQLENLSEAEGNPMEVARYARLLAEVEPSDAHQVDLAEALLENEDPEGALKVLRANQEQVLKDPLAWEEALLKFHSLGADAAVGEIVQAGLAAHELDWRSRLILAEMAIGQGNAETAQRRLWEILEMPADAASPQKTPPSPQIGPAGFGGIYGNPVMAQRFQRIFLYQQNLAQLFGKNQRMGRFRNVQWNPYSGSMGSAPSTPATLEEARDAAVIYLAALAEQQGQEQTFLDELEKKLGTASRKERILLFGAVQAQAPLMREIALEAAQPSGDAELDQYCLGLILDFALQEGRASSMAPEELANIETFLHRIKTPAERIAEQGRYYLLLIQAGQKERADKLSEEVLSQADTATDPGTWQGIFSFAIQRQAFDVAEKVLAHLVALSEQPGQSVLKMMVSGFQTNLGTSLLQKKETVGRGVQLLAAVLRQSYAAHLPGSIASYPSSVRNNFRVRAQANQQFPYPNRYLDEQRIQMWNQIFAQIKEAGATEELKTELNRQIQTLPEDQTVYAQLARACFWWWDDAPGAKGDAIREVAQLARELKDDDLRTMVAVMLAQAGNFTEAMAALEEVSATVGDAASDKQLLMADLAIAAKDTERAKTIALALTTQHLDFERLNELVNLLGKLGMQEEVQRQYKKLSASSSQGQRNTPENQLNQRVQAKDAAGAIALARGILARDPLISLNQGNEGARQMALNALDTFKELPAYLVELENQLAETPTSIRTLYLLAEAAGRNDPKKSLEYYRKLVELKPADTNFQNRLASLLRSSQQPGEAMRIWEAVLARDPESLFMGNFSEVLETFQEAKEMSRLGAALLKTPKPANLGSGLSPFAGFSNRQNYFNQVADALQRENKPKEAIAIWRAALNETDSRMIGSMFDIILRLTSALTEIGDTAGAKATIQNYLFPKTQKKPLFGGGFVEPAQTWMQLNYTGNGVIELPVLSLLRLARQAGILDDLRAQAVAAAKSDDDLNSLLVLLIDSERRDVATLPDFAARLQAATQRAREQPNQMMGQMLFGLAEELREWPEARHLALELMVQGQKTANLPVVANGGVSSAPQIAELAVQLGEKEIAQKALREWLIALRREQSLTQSFDHRTHIRAMNLMVEAGLVDEARSLLKTAKANSRLQNDDTARQEMEAFENRLALLLGQGGNARLSTWTQSPMPNAPTTVYWEIGPAAPKGQGNDQPDRQVIANGEDLPPLDGQYNLELFYGSSPKALRKLATIPAAKSRGAWKSDVTLGSGYLLAIARSQGKVLFSNSFYVPSQPNLLVNPNLESSPAAAPNAGGPKNPAPAGWAGLNAGSFQIRSGGIRTDGHYVDFAPPISMGQMTITQRIPLDAGKKYLFSGWVRGVANQGNLRIEGIFFDKDGKQISQLYGGGGEDRWQQTQHWLVPEGRRNGDEVLPPNAVEIEIRIQVFGHGQIDDLYFGQVPPETSVDLDSGE